MEAGWSATAAIEAAEWALCPAAAMPAGTFALELIASCWWKAWRVSVSPTQQCWLEYALWAAGWTVQADCAAAAGSVELARAGLGGFVESAAAPHAERAAAG